MFAFSVPLALCLAVAAYGFPDTQIVGGRDAPAGKFPYQVSLQMNGRHFCGGSIINQRYILTAAHCVSGQSARNVAVVVGTNVLSAKGEVYQAESLVAHPKYNANLLVNDVAVIRVNRPIAYNSNVKAIALASQSISYEGSACILSGWGTTKAGGSVPDKLQYINLIVETNAKCKQVHNGVQASHICTYTKYGEGACNGDSGGPLVANNVQIGIVSYGRPCGVGAPDVYTRVSSFVSWIKEQQKFFAEEDAQQADIEPMIEA